MVRVNRAAEDAAAVLAEFASREPETAMERMAMVGAKATIKRLERLAAYRDRNSDRLQAYARERSAERRARERAEREAAGEPAKPRGRPRKVTAE